MQCLWPGTTQGVQDSWSSGSLSALKGFSKEVLKARWGRSQDMWSACALTSTWLRVSSQGSVSRLATSILRLQQAWGLCAHGRYGVSVSHLAGVFIPVRQLRHHVLLSRYCREALQQSTWWVCPRAQILLHFSFSMHILLTAVASWGLREAIIFHFLFTYLIFIFGCVILFFNIYILNFYFGCQVSAASCAIFVAPNGLSRPVACGIFICQPGIEPEFPALEGRSLDHQGSSTIVLKALT